MRYLNADKFGGLNDLLFTKLYINNNQLEFFVIYDFYDDQICHFIAPFLF
jgi:hypothetical protein